MIRHQPTGRWRLGLALSLVTVFFWGILPIALKEILQALDAVTITWFRFLVAALVLLVPVLRSGDLGRIAGSGRSFTLLLAAAVLGLCGNYVIYLLGLDLISPSAAQVVVQLAPVFLFIGSIVIFRERFRGVQWAGAAILLTGLALFFNRRLGELLVGGGSLSAGVVLIVAAAASWSFYALAQKQLLHTLASRSVMFAIYAAAAVVLLPVSRPASLASLSALHLGLLGFATVNTLVAYGCFAEALRHWDASRVSLVLTMVPLVTIGVIELAHPLWPALMHPERPNAAGVMGALMVVGGAMLATLHRRRRRPAVSTPAEPGLPPGGLP